MQIMEYVARIANLLMISVSVRALSDSSYCPGVLNHSVVNLVDGWVSQRCHLHTYRMAEVAKCLNLLLLHPPDYARKLSHGKLHIAFIGDSRIRFLFNNFIQVGIQQSHPERYRNMFLVGLFMIDALLVTS